MKKIRVENIFKFANGNFLAVRNFSEFAHEKVFGFRKFSGFINDSFNEIVSGLFEGVSRRSKFF